MWECVSGPDCSTAEIEQSNSDASAARYRTKTHGDYEFNLWCIEPRWSPAVASRTETVDPLPREMHCFDGYDNDRDGFADDGDLDCQSSGGFPTYDKLVLKIDDYAGPNCLDADWRNRVLDDLWARRQAEPANNWVLSFAHAWPAWPGQQEYTDLKACVDSFRADEAGHPIDDLILTGGPRTLFAIKPHSEIDDWCAQAGLGATCPYDDIFYRHRTGVPSLDLGPEDTFTDFLTAVAPSWRDPWTHARSQSVYDPAYIATIEGFGQGNHYCWQDDDADRELATSPIAATLGEGCMVRQGGITELGGSDYSARMSAFTTDIRSVKQRSANVALAATYCNGLNLDSCDPGPKSLWLRYWPENDVRNACIESADPSNVELCKAYTANNKSPGRAADFLGGSNAGADLIGGISPYVASARETGLDYPAVVGDWMEQVDTQVGDSLMICDDTKDLYDSGDRCAMIPATLSYLLDGRFGQSVDYVDTPTGPPDANAGADKAGNQGTSVAFDDCECQNSNTHLWEVLGGTGCPGGAGVTLNDPGPSCTDASVDIDLAATLGDCLFRLTCDGPGGGPDTDLLLLTINAASATPIATTGFEGTTVTTECDGESFGSSGAPTITGAPDCAHTAFGVTEGTEAFYGSLTGTDTVAFEGVLSTPATTLQTVSFDFYFDFAPGTTGQYLVHFLDGSTVIRPELLVKLENSNPAVRARCDATAGSFVELAVATHYRGHLKADPANDECHLEVYDDQGTLVVDIGPAPLANYSQVDGMRFDARSDSAIVVDNVKWWDGDQPESDNAPVVDPDPPPGGAEAGGPYSAMQGYWAQFDGASCPAGYTDFGWVCTGANCGSLTLKHINDVSGGFETTRIVNMDSGLASTIDTFDIRLDCETPGGTQSDTTTVSFTSNAGRACVDGVDCLCDQAIITGDADVRYCEDFEDPDLDGGMVWGVVGSGYPTSATRACRNPLDDLSNTTAPTLEGHNVQGACVNFAKEGDCGATGETDCVENSIGGVQVKGHRLQQNRTNDFHGRIQFGATLSTFGITMLQRFAPNYIGPGDAPDSGPANKGNEYGAGAHSIAMGSSTADAIGRNTPFQGSALGFSGGSYTALKGQYGINGVGNLRYGPDLSDYDWASGAARGEWRCWRVYWQDWGSANAVHKIWLNDVLVNHAIDIDMTSGMNGDPSGIDNFGYNAFYNGTDGTGSGYPYPDTTYRWEDNLIIVEGKEPKTCAEIGFVP